MLYEILFWWTVVGGAASGALTELDSIERWTYDPTIRRVVVLICMGPAVWAAWVAAVVVEFFQEL